MVSLLAVKQLDNFEQTSSPAIQKWWGLYSHVPASPEKRNSFIIFSRVKCTVYCWNVQCSCTPSLWIGFYWSPPLPLWSCPTGQNERPERERGAGRPLLTAKVAPFWECFTGTIVDFRTNLCPLSHASHLDHHPASFHLWNDERRSWDSWRVGSYRSSIFVDASLPTPHPFAFTMVCDRLVRGIHPESELIENTPVTYYMFKGEKSQRNCTSVCYWTCKTRMSFSCWSRNDVQWPASWPQSAYAWAFPQQGRWSRTASGSAHCSPSPRPSYATAPWYLLVVLYRRPTILTEFLSSPSWFISSIWRE